MTSSKNNYNSDSFQKFLDEQQYNKNGILRYEMIFGETYVSTGGQETTTKFCNDLELKSDMRMLDVGCGIGGSAFYVARKYGVLVNGIDLSQNMIDIANERRDEMSAGVKHRVQFHVEDATCMKYPANFYDIVYSRDTILHIEDKESLFRKFLHCLKPGGILLITDYCRGDQDPSKQFKEYVKQRGYNLLTVKDYGATLERAGFGDVEAKDNTDYFIEILKSELSRYKPKKADVLKRFSEADYTAICDGWKEKIDRCGTGDQVWGYFKAQKMYE